VRTETRDSIILTIGTGFTALLSLIFFSIAGRLIDESRFGDFTGATAFIALCTLAIGPINGTVAKFTAQFTARDELGKIVALYGDMSRRCVRYGVFALAAGMLLLFPLAKVLRFASVWPLLIAYGAVFLTMLLCVFRGVLRGMQQYQLLQINSILESAIRLTTGGLLLWIWATTAAGLLAYIVALGAIVIVARAQIRGVLGGHAPMAVDGAAIKRFGPPIFLMMLTSAGFQNVDMLFVKSQFSDLQAGSYGAAFGLARTASALFTPFNIMMLPLMTTLYERRTAAGGTFVRVCVYFLMLVTAPLIVFAIWPDRVMAAMYGGKYIEAAGLLFWITLIRVVGYIGHLIGLTLLSRDEYRFLWIYTPMLLLQGVAMYLAGETFDGLLKAMLVVQSLAAVLLAILLLATRKRPNHRPPLGDRAVY